MSSTRVSAIGQRLGQSHEIGDAVEIHGRLFRSVTAIKIGADADVSGVACDLADVIDVLADLFHLQVEVLWLGAMMRPAVNHHDGVKCHADHGASFD